MHKTAVIGHPVKHSKSPLIHNYWFKKHGIDGEYTAIDIHPDNLKQGVDDIIEKGYRGFNITIPHKETIMNLCDDIDDTARVIGAVNTVRIDDGKLTGFNTDGFGFLENIRRGIAGYNFTNKNVVLIGAGGASRAIIHGLKSENVAGITIVNRTFEKAEKLAAEFDVDAVPWQKRNDVLAQCRLLVNATSLGMTGQPNLDINITHLPLHAVVNDIVYAPLMTPLLKQARQNKHPFVTGIGMLLYQAAQAFNIWFDVMPDVTDELQQKILDS